MQRYISPISQMIVSNGLSARMVAGIAAPLPAALVDYALIKGVKAADAEAVAEPAKTVVEGATVEEVTTAIRELMEAGDADVFGKTGEPKLTPLKSKVGKPVTDAVRDAAWAIVKAEV